MRFYDGFIGDDVQNQKLNYVGGDSLVQFNENCLTQPQDWYYRNVEITYSFNEYGHRCKNLKDVDLENYILFSGCSHTLGTGLELEKTYPYLLSKKLGLDYYNLAIPATGPDVVQHNLLNWYYTINKKPKLILIQWPDYSRFFSYNRDYKTLMEKGSWQKESQRFIVDCEESGLFNARKKLITELITNVIQSPLIKFIYSSQDNYDENPIKMRKYDVARDLAHSGMISHEKITELLYDIAIDRMGLLKP